MSHEMFGMTRFVLLLHSIPYLGEKTLTRLLHHNAQQRLTPEACLALSPEEWGARYDLDPRALTYLAENRDALLAQSETLAQTARKVDLHVLTPQSLTYPDRLERFDDSPPPILYGLGNLGLLNGPASTFSIAVSNGAAPATLTEQDRIAAEYVERGSVPVTGHDRPAYKRLALVAQRQNRSTIYVLDRGLREALGPAFDRPLFAAARIRDAVFDSARDLVLSPFRLDDHSLGEHNRRRDRMIFALADLIIALDVRAGGGMITECLHAHSQGRPVLVVDSGREGNAELLKAGCGKLGR